MIYVKKKPFLVISMEYIDTMEEFNSKNFNFTVPVSNNFRLKVKKDLQHIINECGKNDVFHVAQKLTKYVRSHLSPKNNIIHDLDAVLEFEGKTPAVCSGYAKLLAAVASTLGYKSRVIWMDGHTVSEMWFPGYGWVLVDTNGNLMFKDEKGNYTSLLYTVENFDKVSPKRIASPAGNNPDYLSSGKYSVYKNNSVIVVIEGPRLFDFDVRAKSPSFILKYIFLNKPIAKGIQYIDGGRRKLGNINKFSLLFYIFTTFSKSIKFKRQIKKHEV